VQFGLWCLGGGKKGTVNATKALKHQIPLTWMLNVHDVCSFPKILLLWLDQELKFDYDNSNMVIKG